MDVDDVAVLVDRGDLVVRRNPFDLDGSALRLTPNRSGGYDAARLALPIEPPGTALGLGDDEARAVDLGFAFPFFGAAHPRAFVHSDGHVTFGSPDAGAGAPGLARFLDGGPRIAAFFADFDPSRGGLDLGARRGRARGHPLERASRARARSTGTRSSSPCTRTGRSTWPGRACRPAKASWESRPGGRAK